MKTIYDFKYGLTFRLLAGGVKSWEDLAALRELLRDKAWSDAKLIGDGVMGLKNIGKHEAADGLRALGDGYIMLIEQDIQAIDAYLSQRGIE